MAKIEFWYEFASIYSYPAAMRIETLAGKHNVDVVWKPFLLGPIFKKLGWDTSPFVVYEVKGDYMWRDIARVCRDHNLELCPAPNLPQNGLMAARLALCKVVQPKRAAFSKLVYHWQFAKAADISSHSVLHTILSSLDLDGDAAFREAKSDAVKQALRLNTQIAQEKKIFGAPWFITSGQEPFWGNDRLEQAIEWARDK